MKGQDEQQERSRVATEKTITPPTTWMERLTLSLATSLGWRMARALQANVRNLNVVLVQEDMEVGITNQLLYWKLKTVH
jgi:hypothetical protein